MSLASCFDLLFSAAVFIPHASRLFSSLAVFPKRWHQQQQEMERLSLLVCLFVLYSFLPLFAWIICYIRSITLMFCCCAAFESVINRLVVEKCLELCQIAWHISHKSIDFAILKTYERGVARSGSTWTAWIMNHILFTSPPKVSNSIWA
jgi:hypothetical protein